jgi:predicted Zn-dependent protease
LDGRRRLEDAPEDARPPWDYLTGVHRQQFHVAHALDAAGRAKDADLLRRTQAWAARVRMTFSTPAGAVPADHEGDYIRTMRQALSDLDSPKGPAAANKAAEALSRAYPDAAGPYAIRCEAAVRSRKPLRAEKACDEALRLWDGSVRAQYFGAITDLHRGRPHRARKRLRRAIELDPELDAAWQTLRETLIRQRRRTEVDALETDYRDQFGKSFQ